MARYVLANLRRGLFQDGLKRRSREAAGTMVDRLAAADVVADHDPVDELARRVVVFDADPGDVAALPADRDVSVEPEVKRFPLVAPLPPDLQPTPDDEPLAVAALAGTSTFSGWVTSGVARPAAGCAVQVVAGSARRSYPTTTGRDGSFSVQLPAASTVYAVVVEPYDTYWPTVVYQPPQGVVVGLLPLPTSTLAWQHTAVGINRYQWNVGSGIVVGVADTGCGPHPALAGALPAGAFIDGRVDTAGTAVFDVDVHGTHVCGTIAGRGRPAGIAPGVRLWAARVFASASEGASQADIINAVDNLSRGKQAHIVNLSLGSDQSSRAEHDAIVDAAERGTLVVCAAGNDAGPVGFPASYDEAAAVSALGRDGTVSASSISALRHPADRSLWGRDGFWLADFSDRGVQVDVAAPGVGVVATVPVRSGGSSYPFTALDGTSMASPVAVGVLAVLLSRDAAYRRMARDRSRTEQARRLLALAARSVGLASQFEGAGLPHV